MKKLYNGRYIKTDLIKDALENAKYEGKLKRVPSSKIRHFVDSFEEEIERYKRKVGNNIDPKEVTFLLKQMTRKKHDKVLNSELKEIEKILTDRDFII
ncbi:MAG: hypothetical protein KAI57_00600 [Candidatus Pacebacteria bacterium]|nr:hypothetical protein [Candidatus Paceibacterota bacterium]